MVLSQYMGTDKIEAVAALHSCGGCLLPMYTPLPRQGLSICSTRDMKFLDPGISCAHALQPAFILMPDMSM
jgi:hypothetical protein